MYKITIEETKTVAKVSGKEWTVIDTEEVERENGWGSLPNESKTRMKNVYGYTPEIVKQVSVTREVLVQVVEELDLAKVIKAINGIE